ncbi:acyl carrier protein [Streptomyces sp. NA04227]|uniref:acyl carrier protein n=1 Tax=Streptomyces sp. NA04227 TaxID=2742136 RepID=UPI00158FF0A7|nr:acyl carrier protein [Streptomyces sp. NA04227]QKW06899.1 acyl carrier protein [Streptomyces sp. NA04227]
MSDQLTPGHRLLLEFLDMPELLEGIERDADLTSAGLNSGDLIRLALAIEEQTGSPLEDDELTALHTLDGIDQVLTARGATATAEGAS